MINNINSPIVNNDELNSEKRLNKTMSNKEKIEKIRQIMKFNDEEMNNLKLELALRHDNRSYSLYYISLLKTKHILIFSFLNNKDYNSQIIKMDLFFLNFTIEYAVNALFFNDKTMHKVYEEEGAFDIIYQLPQIIYSFIISTIIEKLLGFLALSQNNITDFKDNKKKKNVNKRAKKLKFKLNIKFSFYFIISSIFLIFFWYYLSMFCAVYKNTQTLLTYNTLLSLGISLIVPFIINLLPGCFRIPAISNRNKGKRYLYNFSKLLQFF